MSGFDKYGIRRLGPIPTPPPRLCGNCRQEGHDRRKCPDLAGLNEFQKRGTWYYYHKPTKAGLIQIKIPHKCIYETEYEATDSPHTCYTKHKCLECWEVMCMGIQLMKEQLEKNPKVEKLRCQRCKSKVCHVWKIERDSGHTVTIIRLICP